MLETLTPVIHVGLVKSVDASLIEAFERLVPQLSSTSKLPEREDLEAIVLSDSTHLLVATDETGRIVGTLTLALFPIPTGIRAWIEDVIVDAGARGRGVGDILNREALSCSKRRSEDSRSYIASDKRGG
jgi:predicted GNAT family N-acyltransferase